MKVVGFAPLVGWIGAVLLSAGSTPMPLGGIAVGLVLLAAYGALVLFKVRPSSEWTRGRVALVALLGLAALLAALQLGLAIASDARTRFFDSAWDAALASSATLVMLFLTLTVLAFAASYTSGPRYKKGFEP